MGHRHSKEQILDGALAVALRDGLSQLTFGRVAKQLDINDRTVVYYFPTKDDLVGDVLGSVGTELQQQLATAFTDPAADHVELTRAAWRVLARPDADPVFALFFEATGLATAGREPYRTIVPALVEAWVEWVAGFIDGTAAYHRAEAEATIALVDGLLLVRQLLGPRQANRAAERLGIA